MPYFFVKVNLPRRVLGNGDLPWMPTIISFEADGALKGIAVFTSWLKAEEFKAQMFFTPESEITPEIVQLGGEGGMPLTEFVSGVTNATRHIRRTYLETPIYIDPPDAYCKMVDAVSHSNLQRFLRRAMRDELESMCEHVSFEEYNGFTIILHERRVDKYYGCSAFRGKFDNAEAMATAIEDARGTTLEKYDLSTDFYPLHETAEMNIKALIDSVVGPEKKTPGIIV